MSKSLQHLSILNIQDEYGTPQKVFDNACKEYKIKPKIDICASKINHVLKNYYTIKDNCFTKEIKKDFFMNPEYSQVANFMAFAFAQHRHNNVSALILTYAKTDTKWWHDYVEPFAEVHFVKGRIQFNDEKGKPKMIWDKKYSRWIKGPAPYPSVWIIFRKKK